MLKKPLIIAMLATSAVAAGVSQPASAGDPVLGALIGGGIGAAIGHSVNGHNGAWVGGALGALTGASIAASSGYYYDGGYYGQPAYAAPASVYGGAYVAPPPVYYSAPPVYYGPSVVVAARPYYAHPHGYGWHREWRGYGHYAYDRDRVRY